jgi:hypothetical protein
LGLGRRLRATGEATEHVEEGLSSPMDETTSVPKADPAVEVRELPARSEEEAPSVAVKEILEDDDDKHDSEVMCRVRVSSRDSLKAPVEARGEDHPGAGAGRLGRKASEARARHEPWQQERQARASTCLDDGDAEGGGEL